MATETLEQPAVVETGATRIGSPAPGIVEVAVSSLPKSGAVPEAKKGSAKDKMFSDLEKMGKPTNSPREEAETKSAEKPAEGEVEAVEKTASAEKTAEVKPGDKSAKGKVNPWKLVDEYKGKVGDLEKQIAEVNRRAIPEAKFKEMETSLTQAKNRVQELEGQIRYVDYSKSEEFKAKFQEPYNKAWERANSELSELTVEGEDGNQRKVTPQDMLQLVNAPLGEARKMAVEKFGDFADDVMAHRKEIRRLYDEQTAALETAKKSAGERETQTREELKKTSEAVVTEWKTANDEALADEKMGVYFKPVEGDEEANARLQKGFELADRAFSVNPMAPGLKPEERSKIVRMHAAVRNRAAAFGKLVYLNSKQQARIASLEKEVSQYKSGEPPAGGGAGGGGGSKPSSARDRMEAELIKRSKPV